jgi:hypothetical protein
MEASTRLCVLSHDTFCYPHSPFHARRRGTFGSFAHPASLGNAPEMAVVLCGLGLSRRLP